jgi:hypothetical protein
MFNSTVIELYTFQVLKTLIKSKPVLISIELVRPWF